MTRHFEAVKFLVHGYEQRMMSKVKRKNWKKMTAKNPLKGFHQKTALLVVALVLGACSAKADFPLLWGGDNHETGPARDLNTLREAVNWGQTNAQTAEKALDAYYTFEHSSHRARVCTQWSRLARHAATRKRMSLDPDPKVMEQILKDSSLLIKLLKRGFHKTLIRNSSMALIQEGRKTYPSSLQRGKPRPLKKRGRIVAYEAEIKGTFPLKGINTKKTVFLSIQLHDGDNLRFKIPIWRLK